MCCDVHRYVYFWSFEYTKSGDLACTCMCNANKEYYRDERADGSQYSQACMPRQAHMRLDNVAAL